MTTKQYRYHVQSVDSAYTDVPEHAWHTALRTNSERTAIVEYRRLYRWHHPQQNAYSGHQRIVDATTLMLVTPADCDFSGKLRLMPVPFTQYDPDVFAAAIA